LPKKKIALIGATGFVGKHLVESLTTDENYEISVLVHKTLPPEFGKLPNLEIVRGNLLDRDTLEPLIKNAGIVINLSFPRNLSHSENLFSIKNIVDTCVQKGVTRFIHLSTAVVAGAARELTITEKTQCMPVKPYEKLKLDIEDLIVKEVSNYELEAVILRPTCIFGIGGANLVKLCDDLLQSSTLKNYARSCTYNRRTLNLIPVQTVVSAIEFLIHSPNIKKIDTFIVSDDEDARNNFWDVEEKVISSLSVKRHWLPKIKVPRYVLSLFLRLLNRSNNNTMRVYSSRKLRDLGWRPDIDLMHAIDKFLHYYYKQ